VDGNPAYAHILKVHALDRGSPVDGTDGDEEIEQKTVEVDIPKREALVDGRIRRRLATLGGKLVNLGAANLFRQLARRLCLLGSHGRGKSDDPPSEGGKK